MQSFKQYRQFGEHVQEQYERDQEKARVLGGNVEGVLAPSANSSTSNLTPLTAMNSPVIVRNNGGPDLEAANSLASTLDGLSPRIGGQSGPFQSSGRLNVPSESNRRPLSWSLREESGRSQHRPPISRRPTLRSNFATNLGRVTTRSSFATNLGRVLTGIDVRRRTPEEGTGEVFVVGYEGEHDPLNPHNWPFSRRLLATINVALIGGVVGWASAIDSAALEQAREAFGVSAVVESLATGLFLVGFGAGSLISGPISETIGRNPVYMITILLYMIFIMASGLAPNIGAQLAFRFLAGLFGATPLTCAGGSISDLWTPMERIFAFPIFANSSFLGSVLGPVVGGYIGQSHRISWRWVEWITLIISGLVFTLIVLFQPETYTPVLLKWKATHLREVTGDHRYHAEAEIRGQSLSTRLVHALYRPFVLIFHEPVIMLIALYMSIINIILFTFLDGYTYIFGDTYGFSEGSTGLAFLGIAVGLLLAFSAVFFVYRHAKHELARVKEKGGDRLTPEFKLWYAMIGAPAIPISLLWMAWTTYPSISYWSPLLASVLFGYGILCVFISSNQYIIDTYESHAASALAGITSLRYTGAGGMTVVGIPMYQNLGVHWAVTILGCISALMVPVPYLFYFYGTKIRAKSKYAAR